MATPIFAPNFTWYKSSYARPNITSIAIVDSYTPTGSETESWDASATNDGSLMVYRTGNALTIAGNGSGSIKMNEDASRMFSYSTNSQAFNNLTEITGMTLLDSSDTVLMNHMFNYCQKLVSADVSSFNTSKVTTVLGMFQRCNAIKTVTGFENWDTSQVTDIRALFNYGYELQNINIGPWDISKVTSLQSMFSQCKNLESIGDVANWDTSQVTSFRTAFQQNEKLEKLNIENWDVSNVTDMGFAFWGCRRFGTLDLSKWNVSNVIDFDHMFSNSRITVLGVENWDTSSAENMEAMFHSVGNKILDVSKFKTSKVKSFGQMFDVSLVEKIIGLENFDTSNSVSFLQMFSKCENLKELNLSSFDTRNAQYGVQVSGNGSVSYVTYEMFNNTPKLEKITLGPNFTFAGNGAEENAPYIGTMPTPSAEYIDGANGNWYTIYGDSYAPSEIPNLTANTYYAKNHSRTYLDKTGVKHLWNKINKKINSSTPNINITNGEADASIIQTGFENGSAANGKGAVALGEGNQAIALRSVVAGNQSVAGIMGYYYSNINFENNEITLTKAQGVAPIEPFTVSYEVGDVISISNNAKYYNCATITAINNNIITVDGLPFTSMAEDNQITMDDQNFFVIAKPLAGEIPLGENAFAVGENTLAADRSSYATGRDTVAYGQYAHAEGRNTKAGFSAHAEGRNTVASGEYSHAEGVGTTASGNRAHAEGNNSQASGLYAHAEGNSAKAQNEAAHAEGYGTVASGIYAHAEGTNTTASKESAHAEGYYTAATGDYSHSEGANTEATKMASHAEGHETTASGEASHSEGSNTTASGTRSHAEGFNTAASGNNSHSEGNGTQATGTESHAEGIQTVASKTASHSEGYSTLADGEYSHAEGRSTEALGNNSHAEGYDSVASGESAHAEGKNTQAKSANAHAEGENTIVEGVAAHAEGKGTQATGAQAHAEGASTKATNYAAHAEGHSTQATNEYTHAEGYGSIASGRFAHAEGRNTIANSEYQHVQGKFNKYLTDNGAPLSYAHIVGNGTSDSNRSNAHTLDWNGNAWFAGRVSAEADPVYSIDLVNKRYLDNTLNNSNMLKLKGTLTELDVLPTNAKLGDTYAIERVVDTGTRVKYVEAQFIQHNETGCYFFSGYIFNLYTEQEGSYTNPYEAPQIDYLIYDTNWNLVCTDNGGVDGEFGLWDPMYINIPEGLSLNQTYYITRADGLEPGDETLPEHIFNSNIISNGISHYMIYNGETFDKLYTSNAIDEELNTIEAIAKGRATGYVFETLSEMTNWLENEKNKSNLVLGDNLYIIDTDIPDYWWDGTEAQVLETQKVDLTEYATKTDLNEYVTESELNSKVDLTAYAKKSDLNEYVKDSDLNSKVKSIGNGYYATEQYVNEKIDTINANNDRVFNTVDEMNSWLAVSGNKETLDIGSKLYIRDSNSPDYWWDGSIAIESKTESIELPHWRTLIDTTLTEEQAGVSRIKIEIPEPEILKTITRMRMLIEIQSGAEGIASQAAQISIGDYNNAAYGCYFGWSTVKCDANKKLTYKGITEFFPINVNSTTKFRHTITFYSAPTIYNDANANGNATKIPSALNTNRFNTHPPYFQLALGSGGIIAAGTRILVEVFE